MIIDMMTTPKATETPITVPDVSLPGNLGVVSGCFVDVVVVTVDLVTADDDMLMDFDIAVDCSSEF